MRLKPIGIFGSKGRVGARPISAWTARTLTWTNLEKQTLGDKEIAGKRIDVDLYRKRIDVRKAVLATDTEKIKNEEDFRKFQLEVDRDRALDASEWEAFKDELLYRKEDRHRDRSFLVAKIELQQAHDLDMIRLANRSDLSLEQKKRQAEELDRELGWQIERAMKKVRGESDIRVAQAELAVKEQRIAAIGQTQTQVEQQLMEIGLAKEKDLARHERARLEIEEKRLKSQLGMENLERIKLMKAAEKDRDQIRYLERQQKELEIQLAREEAAHKREMEKQRADHESEMGPLWGHGRHGHRTADCHLRRLPGRHTRGLGPESEPERHECRSDPGHERPRPPWGVRWRNGPKIPAMRISRPCTNACWPCPRRRPSRSPKPTAKAPTARRECSTPV
jgi:hypothetical protein